MGQEFGAFAHEVYASPEQVTGGMHLGRLDRGLREHPPTKPYRNLVGINLVVCSLPTMDRLHREGVSKDNSNPFLGTEVGEPIPGKEAFDCHHQTVPIGSDSLEEWFRGGFHITVHQDFPVTVHATDVYAPGMQIDTAVKLVWVRVTSPTVSSFVHRLFHPQHTTAVGAEEESSIIIIAVEPTPNSFRSYVAPAIGRGSPPA
jgi:hypothetical protein